MPYKYIGRTTDFKGRTLWEILGNLKNFGIGRLVGRNRFQRYLEPSYIRILKVEVLQNPKASYDEQRKITVLVETIFRGLKNMKLVQMESATYKTDYFLVPKHKGYNFDENIKVPVKVFPRTMELPPLLREIVTKEYENNSMYSAKEPHMKIIYNLTGCNKRYQIAREEEVPTEPELTIGLGNSVTPRLYRNINL